MQLDDDGFLKNSADWNEALAERLAREDNFELSAEHWLLVRLAREYYSEYHVAPGMRILVALLRNHYRDQAQADTASSAKETAPVKVDSRYLYRLFSESPGRQVCRYAGLPKPVSCI
jgi:tRNA 2-thiouridine synthesizing protein E